MTTLAPEIIERKSQGPLLAELKLAGANVERPKAIRCPYHPDEHPSSGIYEEKGVWRFRCHGCGVGGDFLDLRARRENKPVEDVILAYRSEQTDTGGRTDWNRLAGGEPTNTADKPMSLARLKRKLPGKLEATYRYPGLIVFRCITPKGKTFLQARSVDGGWEFGAPPKPWPIYNASRVKGADRVVVAEGEKCVHALHDIGVVATTSPCGAGKAVHADWTPLAGKRVVLWPDNDDTGRDHMRDVAAILEKLDPPAIVSHINPELLELEAKGDAADLIASIDDPAIVRDVVDTILDAAMPDGPAAEFEQYVEDIIAGKYQTEPWPWGQLTDLTEALRPGSLTLVCGEPEAGKSFFLMQCVMSWHDAGIKSAIYELEESRHDHLMRALAMRTSNGKLTRPAWVKAHPDESRAAINEHRDWIDSLGRIMWHSPAELVTVDGMIKWVRERAEEGYRIIVIDPITALEGSAKPWVTDLKLVMDIKTIAVQHGCSVVMVTHPKLGKKNAIGLDNLAGSAAYPRFCQCVLVLAKHNPPEVGSVQMTFGTSRDQSFDRSLFIRKARHSFGGGVRLAYTFSSESLTFGYVGPVKDKDRE